MSGPKVDPDAVERGLERAADELDELVADHLPEELRGGARAMTGALRPVLGDVAELVAGGAGKVLRGLALRLGFGRHDEDPVMAALDVLPYRERRVLVQHLRGRAAEHERLHAERWARVLDALEEAGRAGGKAALRFLPMLIAL